MFLHSLLGAGSDFMENPRMPAVNVTGILAEPYLVLYVYKGKGTETSTNPQSQEIGSF